MDFTMPSFRRPFLAWAVLMLTVLAVVSAAVPAEHVEKFGALLATGLGVMFLASSGRQALEGRQNLAILMVVAAGVCLLAGIFLTPGSVWTASALEDYVGHIIGAAGGLFVKEED